MHLLAPFHAVIVEKRDRLQTEIAPRGEFLRQRGPDNSRTDDAGASCALVGRAAGAGARACAARRKPRRWRSTPAPRTEVGHHHAARRRIFRTELRGDAEHHNARREQNPHQPGKIQQLK